MSTRSMLLAVFTATSVAVLKMSMILCLDVETSLVMATSIGSVYEVADPGCQSCVDPNAGDGSCSCSSGQTITASLRTLNDCAGPGILHGGNIEICSTTFGTSSGGVFQVDDSVPGGMGCRAPNSMTGGCSCPSGYVTQMLRTLADVPGGSFVGSNFGLCLNPSGRDAFFGGAYQVHDDGACSAGNEYNAGQCSCPPGYTGTTTRTIVDGPSGAELTWCTNTTTSLVEICPGVYADANGLSDASPAINQCLAAAPSGGTVSLPPGVYGVASQVTIANKAVTLTTRGIAISDGRVCEYSSGMRHGACATLRALPGCCSSGGILTLSGAHGAVVAHIVLDGNRFARLETAAGLSCINGADNRQMATNGYVMSSDNVTWTGSASINALCASGLEWSGDGCNIANSFFGNNGDHPKRVSDGLTLLQCRWGTVTNVVFVDNSDVNFIHGCSQGTTVTGVTIQMVASNSYAGIMLDDFDGSTCGNYEGMVLSQATIQCGTFQCDFGIEVGPLAWYEAHNVIGGTIDTVSIIGPKQGVNVAGGGTAAAPTTIVNVALAGNYPPSAMFNCGPHQTSAFNIAPGSYVNRGGQNNPPATSFAWNGCP